MKARVPKQGGAGNMQNMMKQAQKMQEEAELLQGELEEKEHTASAGGGMVEVTVNGKHEVKSIQMKPEIVDPEDIEMLEDMLIAAVNEAMRQADQLMETEMGKLTGGLNLPGIF